MSGQQSEKLSWKWGAGIFFISILFFFAPAWTPYLAVINGRSMFLSADVFQWISAILLAAYLSQTFIPAGIFKSSANWFSYRPWSVFFILAGTLVGLITINREILHSFLNSADEHSCYFLAECLRMGQWFVEPHALSEFFNVVHVGNKAGKWFSVYPPGWPALWALGMQLQIQDWINPILSVSGLFFFYLTGCRLFGKQTGIAALFLTAITPFFLFTGASYFSHSTCFFTMALFSWSYLKWTDAETPKAQIKWAIILALAVGYGLATRYLTMAVFAAPFLLISFKNILLRKEKPRTDHYVIVGILAAFMLLIFYQNYVISGKPLKAPNKFDKSWERLGFRGDYSVLDGILFIFARFFYLMDWAPSLFPILYFIFLFRKTPELNLDQKLFRWSFLFPVFAYFFYFSWGGNQYGPRYYYEAFPFLVLTICEGIGRSWKSDSGGVKKLLFFVVLGSLIQNAYLLHKQGNYFEKVSAQRKALYQLAEETITVPSIIFIRGFLGQELVMSQEDAVRNHPSLESKILYAHDRGEDNQRLMNYYPDRVYYRGTFDRERLKAELELLSS